MAACLALYAVIITTVLTVGRRRPAVPEARLVDNSPFSVLSRQEISRYRPFTRYAGAAYCRPEEVLAWNCGATCDAISSFKPVAAGGDGSGVQYWYVGYDSTLKTIIVAHQGTNPRKFMAVLTDLQVRMTNLDSQYFPGLPPTIRVHYGFLDVHLMTAINITSAVKRAIEESGYRNVTMVGHSLGAALALLDSLYLPILIPNAHYTLITYGMPRVGNEAFADYVDRHVNVTRITNKNDPVPILPGRRGGFTHPKGERHIRADGTWVYCPGRDNTDQRCTIADVPNLEAGNVTYHNGPYDDVLTNCHTNDTTG